VLGNTGLIVTPGAIRTDWAGRSIITAGANWLRNWSARASSLVCSDRGPRRRREGRP
jgi:hypothetical protein